MTSALKFYKTSFFMQFFLICILNTCFFLQIKSILPLVQFYNSTVQLYGRRSIKGVHALESVQRKFAKYLLFRLIAEFPPRGTPNSVHNMANLRSLNMRRNDSFLIFLYKIIHGIINSPFLLSQICFNVPRANLRSGRFFYVPRAVTNILHRSLLYTACTLFNSNCSECYIFVISLGQFKRLITCISEV
jgi:hypothetical protein